jgi:hypothetical protein
MPEASLRRAARRKEKPVPEPLPPFLRFKQKQSGKEKQLRTGFAWDLFLFAGLFGLPLFLRRLPQWGALILALWLIDLLIGRLPLGRPIGALAEAALFGAFLLAQLWLGFRGNRLTAKALLAHGWRVERPEDRATKRLIERWRLAD